jgi:hypothetical protein
VLTAQNRPEMGDFTHLDLRASKYRTGFAINDRALVATLSTRRTGMADASTMLHTMD